MGDTAVALLCLLSADLWPRVMETEIGGAPFTMWHRKDFITFTH